MSEPTNAPTTMHPAVPRPDERRMAVPMTPGTYHIGAYRVIVRKRRADPMWLNNERIRFLADQRGWSRTAFARHCRVDNSYTAPKIWGDAVTKVTEPVAERIAEALEVPLAEVAHLTPEGESYDPR